MFQKHYIEKIKVIGFAILMIKLLLNVNIAMACPDGQVSCGDNACCDASNIRCAVPITTQSGAVGCALNLENENSSILCTMTEFNDISVSFQTIPSEQQLSEAFFLQCYEKSTCSEKFQCTNCPEGTYRCTQNACCPV